MPDITFRVYRTRTEQWPDIEGREVYAQQRSELLHELADELDLNVKDWGETDGKYPHEDVDWILAMGSAGVFTAMVQAFQAAIKLLKINEVKIVKSDGSTIRLTGATRRQIEAVAKTFGLAASED